MPVSVSAKTKSAADLRVRRSPSRRQYPERVNPGSIGFVPQLESLRGVGALMVAAVHAAQSHTSANLTLVTDPNSWTHPVWSALFAAYRTMSNGRGALIVFFVLSGFVLASSIERGPQGVRPGAGHFFIGRIFRLYPAIISTVLLFAVLFWLTGAAIPGVTAAAYSVENIVQNMLLIRTNIDGVMWTLQVEALAIPLIFAVTIAQRHLGGRFTLAVAVLLVTISFWRPLKNLVADDRVFAALYAFVLGIGIHRIGPLVLQRIGAHRVGWVVSGALVFFFAPRAVFGQTSKWPAFFECVSGMAMIAVLVYGGATVFARVLNWPVFRFYGRISYSFYLLHPLTFILMWTIPRPLLRLLDAGVPAVLLAFGLTIVSALAITPIAWLSWRFVEIPGIAVGRHLSPERRNASPYVGPTGRVVH